MLSSLPVRQAVPPTYFSLDGQSVDTPPAGVTQDANDTRFSSSDRDDALDTFIDQSSSTDEVIDEYFNADRFSPGS